MSGSLHLVVALGPGVVEYDDGVRRSYDYSQGAEHVEAEIARKRQERERRIRELEPELAAALEPWTPLLIAPDAAQASASTLTVTAADVGISTFREASVLMRSTVPLPVAEVRAALRGFISAVLELH